MEYITATRNDLQEIYHVVQESIKTIYPKYYPKEVIDFFCELHSKEKIQNDIEKGHVGIVKKDNQIIGTGCYNENHITRVYVSPAFQGQGYGSYIMQCLENIIASNYDVVNLDASLPAAKLYEKLGYQTIQHEKFEVNHGVILAYEIMEKKLSKITTDISYDGKTFIPKMNTENGEVDSQTIFTYHQKGNMLWADYAGGEIIKGHLIGTVTQNGELDFYYHHINEQHQVRVGVCHSVPHILENEKLELAEEWQWLNGDCSKGESILIET